MPSKAAKDVANKLRTEVLAGYFGAGRLPSVSDMVQRYKTSRHFVMQAIGQLLEEGLLTVRKKQLYAAGTSWEAGIQAARIAIEERRLAAKTDKQIVPPEPPLVISGLTGEHPFYVYTHSFPVDVFTPDGYELSNVVFYVGKGTVAQSPRIQRIDTHEKQALWQSSDFPVYSVNKYMRHTIKWIWKQGKSVVKQIIFESANEIEVFNFERKAIQQFASPYLTNVQQNPCVDQRILFPGEPSFSVGNVNLVETDDF